MKNGSSFPGRNQLLNPKTGPPRGILKFIKVVKQKGKTAEKCAINGVMCYILDEHMTIKKQLSIILIFVKAEDLL